MKRIYVAHGDAAADICHFSTQDGDILRGLDGTPVQGRWKPLDLTVGPPDGSSVLSGSDAPWFGTHVLVLTPRAVEVVSSVVGSGVEFLELSSNVGDFFLLNVVTLAAAVDVSRSDCLTFSDGLVGLVTQYELHWGNLRGVQICRDPQFRVSPIFFGEEFVDRWMSAELTGLSFEEVGRSEGGTRF